MGTELLPLSTQRTDQGFLFSERVPCHIIEGKKRVGGGGDLQVKISSTAIKSNLN